LASNYTIFVVKIKSFMTTSSFIGKLSAATIGVAFINVGAVFPDAAQALTLITSRTALESNDSVNWAVLGPQFTDVPNPFSVKSSGGLGLTVSQTSGTFQRLDQGGGVWRGNFAQDDALLFTRRNNPGPITIDFDVPILGAGTQIQAAGGTTSIFNFPATIEAFDRLGNSLGSFTLQGTSEFGGVSDNSAIFMGVRSDSANIAKLTINGETEPGSGFAINQLDLVSTDVTSPKSVPEPASTVALLALGGFGVCSRLLRKHPNRK
jgi:hypothetical protein